MVTLLFSNTSAHGAVPISRLFYALIIDGITFDALIKKSEIWDAVTGLSSSIFPVESNERANNFL